jgi:hypothetical protein
VARLESLRAALLIARAQADKADGSVHPTRFAAALQLSALINFVEADPECPSVAELRELHAALLNVENGRRVDWLIPPKKPKGGGQTVEIREAAIHGRYAFVMDYLMTAGNLSEKQAAKFVEEHSGLRRAGMGRSESLWRTVYNWRQRALALPDSNERLGFEAMRTTVAISEIARPELPAQALAKLVLRELKKFAPARKNLLDPEVK